MMDCIKIAGHTFGFNPRSNATKALLGPYLCSCSAPELQIDISDNDLLDFSQEKDEHNEFYILHKKIAEYLLLHHDTLLFHGSCLAFDDKGIIFTAPSGVGKSTHARLWRERFGERVEMINDDKPLLAFEPDGTVRVYGSPWCGKEQIGNNIDAPLHAIVCLRKAPENNLRQLSSSEALSIMLHQALMPLDIHLRLKAISLIQRLITLPIYELKCTPTLAAVDLSLTTLK